MVAASEVRGEKNPKPPGFLFFPLSSRLTAVRRDRGAFRGFKGGGGKGAEAVLGQVRTGFLGSEVARGGKWPLSKASFPPRQHCAMQERSKTNPNLYFHFS